MVFVILFVLMIAWFSKDLPTPNKLKNLKVSESTQFFDRNGNRLYSATGTKMRILTDKNKIPEQMKQATIAIEDNRFYQHHGLDFKGIIRGTILRPITGQGIQGGSTITQQFVKNALLNPKRTPIRKIKEAILAVELEMLYSKDDILTMYLNEIPYGSNAYGVEAASQIYFSKHIQDLNLSEIATLAALPQAPTYYSPYGTHTKELFYRRDYVLDKMVKLGYISDKEAKQAKKQEVTFKRMKENIKAPHFVMYAKEVIAEKYGDRVIEEGGLKVYTTIDGNLQAIAEEEVEKGAERNQQTFSGSNSGLVAIDPKTGEILAMVGSKDYFDMEHDGNVNVTLALRSPGSSFKPVVYATGFKDKWAPASTLFDLKTDFGGGYIPQNFNQNFNGPISIREALGNSLNIPAVKMMGIAGIDNVIDTAKDMGITTLTDRKNYGLSLAIGGGSTKLIEVTGAFGVFANGGKRAETTPILKIVDNRGKTIFENKPKPKQVIDEQIAYEISEILSDNSARARVFGLNSYLVVPGKTVAVKTGTSEDYRDAHTIGYTPSLVSGVWVGNNDNSPMTNHAAASMAAAPIWNGFMSRALADKPNEWLQRPEGIRTLTVDSLTGMLPGPVSPLGTRTDLFATWQVPKEKADVYNTVKIDAACGDKLASDLTPADMIIEKTYANVHSEMPQNPSWEGPVRAWAVGAGLGSVAPTEVCDVHTEGNRPSVSITSPAESASVGGLTKFAITANAPLGISRVEYSIDGVLTNSATSSPWSINYNVNNLSVGVHKVSVRLVDKGGLTATDSNNFSVSGDASAPGEITWGSPAVSGAGSGKLTISWVNPVDSDLSKVHIYRGTAPGSLYEVGSGQSASPGQAQTYTMSGLVSGTTYYFKIKTSDAYGNLSSGSSVVSGICP